MLLWLIETDVFQTPQLHKHFNVVRNRKTTAFGAAGQEAKKLQNALATRHHFMLRDKTVVSLLLTYILLQLGALFLGVGLFLFAYVIAYIIAIIHSAIKSSRAMTQSSSVKDAAYSLSWFFIANLALFLIYLPTLIYNPEINWKLKGGVEQDPMILQAYVPIVFFIIAATIIIVTLLVTKLILLYKAKRTRLMQ